MIKTKFKLIMSKNGVAVAKKRKVRKTAAKHARDAKK